MSDSPVPTQLSRVDAGIRIRWSDDQVREYLAKDLRAACPCATCREQRAAPPPPATSLTVISLEETRPLGIAALSPVGNYAYTVAFSDGHDTGIFTLELLRGLGRQVTE